MISKRRFTVMISRCFRHIHAFFFGPKNLCPNRVKRTTCTAHKKPISDALKFAIGLFGPVLAFIWITTINLQQTFEQLLTSVDEARVVTGYGIGIVWVAISIFWLFSLILTTHAKLDTLFGYIGVAVAAPFTTFSILSPLVERIGN